MTPSQLEQLFSLTNEYRSIKYDLKNIQLLMERLNNPQNTFRSILVAGTNGKGSVAAFLSAMMPEAGLYTSPHLERLNERIRIGAIPISDEDLGVVYEKVAAAADGGRGLLYPPSYFEMVTAMALTWFAGRVERAVIEVGMGGRLDATNIVRQEVSVITSVGLDHQKFLGTTVEQIAAEKAGIIKAEPVVVGPEAEFDVIRRAAGERLFTTRHIQRTVRSLGDGRFEIDLTTPIRQYRGLKPQLRGRHQIENVIVAVRAAECFKLSRDRIENGINSAVWPGRLERLSGAPSFLLDGAHNAPAAAALAAFLEEVHPGGVCMIFGCMKDKDHESMLRVLTPHVRTMIFTRAAGERAQDPAVLQPFVRGSLVETDVATAIDLARRTAGAADTVVVCGSLYLIGEARSVLGGSGAN